MIHHEVGYVRSIIKSWTWVDSAAIHCKMKEVCQRSRRREGEQATLWDGSVPQITHLCTNLPLLKFNIYSHMKAKLLSRFILFVTPWTIQSVNSPGQNPGVGNHCIIQVILPTQGSNLVLPHCRQILYQLSHKGSPRILQWVAYPFSSAPSRPRNWTGVSWIAGGFFTNWTMREALTRHKTALKSHTSPEHFLRVIWEAVF